MQRIERTPEFEAEWAVMKDLLESFVDTYAHAYTRRKILLAQAVAIQMDMEGGD